MYALLIYCAQDCSFQYIEEPPSEPFCDPTTFQPTLSLGCTVTSSLQAPFTDLLWFVDRGRGPKHVSTNQQTTQRVRVNNGRRTVGGTLTLTQPFLPGRYWCRPKLLINSTFLQSSQTFELQPISTYLGLLPCRINDTLSSLTSRCADLGSATNIVDPFLSATSILEQSSPTPTPDATIGLNGDTGSQQNISICAASSATILALVLVAMVTVNVIHCYYWRRKLLNISTTIPKVESTQRQTGVAELHDSNSSGQSMGGPVAQYQDTDNTDTDGYVYPGPFATQSTQALGTPTSHEPSTPAYIELSTTTSDHQSFFSSTPPVPSPVPSHHYASLSGGMEYSHHYTTLLNSNMPQYRNH